MHGRTVGCLFAEGCERPFRVRLSSARIFGITKNERGQVHLTDLGRVIADPKTEAAARVEAFLSVELYKAVFDKYRKFTLPGSSGLESEMQSLGVSPKQVDKARQAFLRSAEQAGFFAHGKDRLVQPSVGALPLTKPIERQVKEHGGGSGGGGGDLHPLIRGLVDSLPAPGSEWADDDCANWLQAAAFNFRLIYKGLGGIKVEVAEDKATSKN
jgi:hypothetical protein